MYKWHYVMGRHTQAATRQGKIRFNVTLTTDANRALRQLAKLEARSKSNMLEVLIRRESKREESATAVAA